MEHKDNGTPRISKEEMARRISGSLSTARAAGDPVTDAYYAAQRAQSPQRQNAQRSSAKGSSAQRRPAPKKSASARARRKKHRQKRILMTCSAVMIFLLIVAGGSFAWFSYGKSKYDGIFLENTYINGTNVSKMTPDEAVKAVIQDSDMPDKIILTDSAKKEVQIDLNDIGKKDNVAAAVAQIYGGQDHNDWLKAESNKSEYSFKTEFTYDNDKLREIIDKEIVNNADPKKSKSAYIQRTEDGFEIVPEVIGTKVDKEKTDILYDYIDGFLERGEYSINLSKCACYKQPKVTSLDLSEDLENLNSIYSIQFNFDFNYTVEVLDGSRIIDWITFEDDDPTGSYSVDTEKVEEYVEELADKYDTYNTTRTFNSTTRGKIKVKQGEGDYGWWIDKDKTRDLIIDLIKEGDSADVEPIYYTSPYSYYSYTCNPDARSKKDDIGDTYIEIDLKEQHFWYYKKGKLKHECYIISGMPTEERNTPGGIYKLWYKEKNKVLKGSLSTGEKWETPVTFWNNVSTFGVGLHDANWQSSFGGNIYTYSGSHGCINMSYNDAKYVYDEIPLDTPVVMYW